MKRIVITGGAGFIGSHTVDRCLAEGAEVVVIDNFSTGKLSYLNVFHPHLRVVQGDILDQALLQREIKTCDAVLHLAALPSVQHSLEDPVGSMQVNTVGFLQVLEAIRQCQKPVRLVYASSAAIYGASYVLPCEEEASLVAPPLSPYALEKMNNERYAELYARLFGVPALGLRYFNVYGERQDPKSPYSGVMSRFLAAYEQHAPLTVYGDGEQTRDFIAVRDVAYANWLALTHDCCGVLNIATGIPQSINQLIACIETVTGPLPRHAMPGRPGDILHSCGDGAKARAMLGFYYTVSLQQGIADLLGKSRQTK